MIPTNLQRDMLFVKGFYNPCLCARYRKISEVLIWRPTTTAFVAWDPGASTITCHRPSCQVTAVIDCPSESFHWVWVPTIPLPKLRGGQQIGSFTILVGMTVMTERRMVAKISSRRRCENLCLLRTGMRFFAITGGVARGR